MDGTQQALVELALRVLPPDAPIAFLGAPAVLPTSLAARRVATVSGDDALSYLHERSAAPVDALLAVRPTRHAPLLPFLAAAHDALAPTGRALVADLVWQTAPSLALLQAFAPPAGRDKVRPIEGYEMQIDHSGFAIEERVEVERARWALDLPPEQRAAVEADDRGAARVVAWVLARAEEGEPDA